MSNLECDLESHPDRGFVSYLINGIKYGFDPGLDSHPADSFQCRNLLSATKNSDFVASALADEVASGHIIGPLESLPFNNFRISPIGVATRKFTGKQRLILDLSAPHDSEEISSINDLISKEDFSLKYVTIDDAINIICDLGEGALLTKFDIKNAFRILPLAPESWRFFCMCWDKKYYFYCRLAFGCRSSPKIFTHLSEAVHWIAVNNKDISHCLYLLDDFLCLDHKNNDAAGTKQTMLTLFDQLGIELNSKKTAGPATCLEYLGIELDSVTMQARLPPDKLSRIRLILTSFLQKPHCSKRELLSLIGHLVFAARVCVPGRTFISRLFHASQSVHHLNHIVYLTREAKADIAMWSHLLHSWNGVSFFHDKAWLSSHDITLCTDASSTVGFGAYYKATQECMADTWSNHPVPVSDQAMSYRELYPILVSAIQWGHLWQCKRIVFINDNQGLVAIITKGRSHCPAINTLLRRLVIVAAQCNFLFKATWIDTKSNFLADALSRGQIDCFQALAPAARRVPCPPQGEIVFTTN